MCFLSLHQNNKTFRGEEGEQIQGEDAAVTNGAVANGNGENPNAEWVVASRCKSNIKQTSEMKYLT